MWEFVANLKGLKGDIGDWARRALTSADVLDTFMEEGKFSLQSSTVAAAIGSPISPFGSLEVLGVGASAIQRIAGTDGDPRKFERGTTAGGAAWGEWRRTDHDTKIVLHQLSSPSNGSLNEVAASRHVRIPLKLAAQVDGFRLYFRNFNDRESLNYAGDLTFSGVFIGKRAKDSFGLYTEDFAETPISLGLPTRTTLSDGSYRWAVSTKYYKLEANTEYLISYGYTTPAGQVNHVGYSGAYLGTVPGAADYVDASGMTWSPTAPLDVYMTLIVPEDTPTFGYLGSSTPAGANTNHPLRDSFAWRHAYAEGAIPTVLAHAGSAMTSWTSTADWKWQKARAYARMDRMYFSLGSNDVNGAATLEELKDRNNTVADVIRSQVADQLFYVNIAPRAAEDPAIQTKRVAYNEWLDGLPNGALATHDVASVVSGPDGSLAPIYDSGDGVHLNELGQRKTAEAVIKAGGSQGTPGPAGIGFPTGGTALQIPRINSTGTTTEFVTPTKSLVGLGNVDNTADADKPVSAPQAAALAGKVSKGEIVYTVTDYATPADAVAAAFTAGATLHWPAGDYVTTASIPNLHKVKHVGSGRILRGTDIFYPCPTLANANTLYVATTGTSSNDGLSPSEPINLLSKAFSYLPNYGTWLQGDWAIRLAAGTYNDGAITGQKSTKRLWIYGPEVPVGATPTAIFDPGATSFGKAIGGNDYLNIGIRDIKVQNYLVPESPAIDFTTHCAVGLINVHAVGNDIGFRFMSHTTYSAAGIVAANNVQYGISELFSVVRDFKAGGESNPSYLYGNGKHGIKSKELCTGHLDYARIYDNKHGVHFSRSCTANGTSAQIYRNQYGVTLRNQSAFVPLNTDWKFGTVDANTVTPWDVDGTSSFVNSENEAAVSGLFTGRGERQLGYFAPATAYVHTGTTAATTVVSFGNLLRGTLMRSGGYLRTVIIGSRSGTGGVINLEFRFGGSGAGIIAIPTTAGAFKAEITIYSQGPGKQTVYVASDIAGLANGILARTYDTAAVDTLLSLRATLVNAADTLTINGAWCHTTEVLASEG